MAAGIHGFTGGAAMRGRARAGLGLLAAAAGAWLPAACTVGPNYAPPRLKMDGAFGPLVAGTNPATEPAGVVVDGALQEWWKSFNDPLLDQLIARGLAANLDLRQAALRIRAARSQEAQVAGGAYPQVNANGGYTRQRYSQNAAPFNAFNVPGFPWEFNLYELGFDASWEVDIFGGTRRAVEAAGADYAAALEDASAVRVSVAAEVARNYIELRGYQHEEELARRNLAVQKESLEITQEQMNKGVGTQLDVSRAQAEVAATEAAIPVLERGAWEAIVRLSVLTNDSTDNLQILEDARPLPGVPASVVVGVPADLLRRRPDVRAAERRLAAATARIGEAQAALYPRLSLTGFFNLQSASISDLFQWKSRAFSLGPAVEWPIFEAGTLRAAVDVRTAQQAERLAAYEAVVRQAVADVRDSLVEFTTERQRGGSLEQAVAADRTALELAQGLYRQGLTDFLTVLDAERELFSAEDALARSESDEETSLVGLYKALGGGWQADRRAAGATTQDANDAVKHE
ncbi:MAG TPA: efflux transporter outer membrane subunit [Phycisphaerae bacterium]|nr:efflux transporter outer membrane subunit [Phycisphaerae bacterium]